MITERLRVLLVSPAVAPPPGGIPAFTENVLRSVDGRASVRLCGLGAVPVADDDRRVVRGSASSRAAVFRFARAIRRELRRGAYDVVHAVTWRSLVPSLTIRRKKRPAIVVHAHGSELLRAGRLATRLRARAFARADAIVAVSEHTADVVERITGRRPAVVPNGIASMPGDVLPPAPGRRRLRVLSVGRLVPRKGHVELVEAVAKARAAGADLELVIVGEGPERERIERAVAEADAESWATLAGEVDTDGLDRAYRDADLFALLSRDVGDEFEGFGIVFVEAASYGLPIVAGDSGGSIEAVAPDVNAIVATDREAASAALVALWRDTARRSEMSEASRRHAERFLPSALGPRLVGVYHEAIERRAQR